MPFFHKGNKEDLVFEGIWNTRDGSRVRVRNGIATVITSKHEYLKNFQFPVDNLGKCSVSPDMDLVERDRTTEGYTR